MFIDLTPEQHALRLRVRDYFSALMTPELRLALRGAESGALFRDTVRRMGSDGWLAVGWPKASSMAILSVIAMSIGAVAVGAGTFGQWLRADELGPHKYAPYLLIAGAILLLGVALFGQGTAKPIRVGDAGV